VEPPRTGSASPHPLQNSRLRNLAVYAVHKLTNGPRLALLSSFDQLFSNPTQPDVGAFGIESDEERLIELALLSRTIWIGDLSWFEWHFL
jgi:hypothetical protein